MKKEIHPDWKRILHVLDDVQDSSVTDPSQQLDPETSKELHQQEHSNLRKIPFYANYQHNTHQTFHEPDQYFYISSLLCPQGDFLVRYDGNLLSPRLESGSYLLLKEHVGEIVYDQIYLICTDWFRIFRIVRPAEDTQQIRLVTLRSESTDEHILARNSIRSIYWVCGAISPLIG